MERGVESSAFLTDNQDPILHVYTNECEASRILFRQFKYIQAGEPAENFSILLELCSNWLKPKVRSLQDIMELLVMEQFLSILPAELVAQLDAHGPQKKERLFAQIEQLQRERKTSGHEFDLHDLPYQELDMFQSVPPIPEMQLELAVPIALEAAEVTPVPEDCNPQSELENDPDTIYLYSEDPGPETPRSEWNYAWVIGHELLTEEQPHSESLEQSSEPQTDWSVLHSLVLLSDGEQLEALQDTSEIQLLGVVTEPVDIQVTSVEEIPQSSCEDLSLNARASQQMPSVASPSVFPSLAQHWNNIKASPEHSTSEVEEVHFTCSKCQLVFLLQSDLDKHQLFHRNEKPFQCTQCSMEFSHLEHLKQYKLKHYKKPVYQCPVCKENFTHWESLRDHRKTHSDIKRH